MEKKRSKGVVFWGIALIIFFVLSILVSTFGIINEHKRYISLAEKFFGIEKSKITVLESIFARLKYYVSPMRILLVGLIFCIYICPLIAGVGILKLKNWARRIAISTSSFWFLFLIYKFFMYITKDIYDYNLSPFPEIKLFYIKKWFILGSIFIQFFSFFILCIFYLTRPKVKAQFSPERGEAESKEAV